MGAWVAGPAANARGRTSTALDDHGAASADGSRDQPPNARGRTSTALDDRPMTTTGAEWRPIAERISRRAARAGLEVDSPLLRLLAAYVDFLMRWNRHINLTALRADDHGIDRLIVEPLVAAQHLPTSEAAVVDIGSGGGSPAVPMKLAAPAVRLRMVESRTRKAAFLRELVRHLGLDRTVVEACRYEELATRAELLGESDVVTVRAVRVERRLLRRIQPLVSPRGAVFLFRNARRNLDARALSPWRVDAAWPLLDPDHRLVILKRDGA